MTALPSIGELLPHTGSMLLLDALIGETENGVRCRTTIGENFIFISNGRVDIAVAIELIAQTVGACVGLEDRRKGRPPRIGFLVGVRVATFLVDALLPGDVLEITATHVWGEETLGNFRGAVELVRRASENDLDKAAGPRVVATCELSVYAGDLAGVGPARTQ